MTEKAFGLLIRLAVKTGIRASDLLNLEYIQFKENREYPNTFTYIRLLKPSLKNIIPVGAELMRIIQVYELECLSEYGYKSKHLFHNYSTGKNYTRVWASIVKQMTVVYLVRC
jgi:integrase